MFFNTTAIAYLSWAKTLFQLFKGFEPLAASIMASVLMYAAVIFVPFFGWAADKSGRRKPFMVAGSVAMALALIATSYASGVTLLPSVIVLGIAAATVPPIVMTIPPESLPPHLAGTAFSIVTLCQNVGITLSAPLAGYLIQTTGDLSLTFFGISLFAFAAAVTALTLKTK
jgi:MFS family permease